MSLDEKKDGNDGLFSPGPYLNEDIKEIYEGCSRNTRQSFITLPLLLEFY